MSELTKGLRGDLRTGEGKHVTSGFAYWGIGPTIAGPPPASGAPRPARRYCASATTTWAVLDEDMKPMTPANARRRVYPRLLTSALTMAIASGEFNGRSDERILAAMLACQDDITQLNHRLDLLEQRMFLAASISPQDLVDLDWPLYRPDGYVAEVRASLEDLVNAWQPPRTGPPAWRRPGRSRR